MSSEEQRKSDDFLRVRIFYRLSRLVRAILEVRDACKALQTTLAGARLDNLAQAQATAASQVQQATQALENFGTSSDTFVGANEVVAVPFATFAAVLAQSCGKLPPGFVPCAVKSDDKDRPIPLVAG